MALTRRSFIARATACVGGAVAFAALPPTAAEAAAGCRKISYSPPGICLNGTTNNCRVRFGPPSCTSSEVTVYSPNNAYELGCTCNCGCNCSPKYFQARGAANNQGSCSCTCVNAS
jgi:hypothetical protein